MNLRLKRLFGSGIALACTCALTLTCLPAGATDVTSLENTTSDLDNQLTGINSELLAISEQIDTLQKQVKMTNGELARTQEELSRAKEDEASQYEDMKARIKYMYEAGNNSLLEMLLSADSLADFLNKAEFIQNISEYDRDRLTKLEDTRSGIESAQQTLIEQQASLEELQRQMDEQQAQLQQKAADTSANLEAVRAELSKKKAEEAARLKAAGEAQRLAANQGTVTESSTTEGSVAQTDNVVPAASDEVTLLAALLECEAYPQYNYMLAVATIVMNRVNSPIFPNTITEVIYAPGQFYPAGETKLSRKIAEGPSELGYQVAQDAINGARLAEVSDCFFYLAAFATEGITGVDVGGNVFFQSWP